MHTITFPPRSNYTIIVVIISRLGIIPFRVDEIVCDETIFNNMNISTVDPHEHFKQYPEAARP